MRPIRAALTLLVLAAPAAAQENVYKKTLPSTVWVVQQTGRMGNQISLRMGSGSLIDVKNRYILTNYHVIGELDECTVFFPQFDKKNALISEKDKYVELLQAGGGIKGTVKARDVKRDLAIVQLAALPPKTPALRLAKDSPGPGDHVHSIGSPGISGAVFAYTPGDVKAVYNKKWQVLRGDKEPPLTLEAKVIETTSPTNKGDSGGPLVNDKGELVAVTQGGASGDGARAISYFIDVSEVRALIKEHKLPFVPAVGSAAVSAAKPDEPGPAKAPAASDAEKNEKAAASMLDFAQAFIKDGKTALAVTRLEELVKKYPDTAAAKEARDLIEKHKK